MKNKVIIIAGPTASGKTALAIDICKKFDGEVISADSMQIYKGMDIATAKPTKEEMADITHHLIDIVEPTSPFSVSQFKVLADKAIQDILSRGKLPVIAGGTGLYIDAVINNTCFEEFSCDQDFRDQMKQLADTQGNQSLLDRLMQIDPDCASRLHANDLKRIIRALEVYHCTGKTLTCHEKESRVRKSDYEFLFLGLFFQDRQALYDRINLRVDKMIEAGLEKEARNALSKADLPTACQAIGYKELKPYFDGDMSLAQALESLKKSTRNYAKRQLTWFRRYDNIIKIHPDKNEVEKVEDIVRSFLK